jgi:hypothetical protein
MQIFFYLFGAITLAGAVQGFLAGSKISLIAGGILAALVLAGSYLSSGQPVLGNILILVGALGVAGKFVPAYFTKGHAIWPAGVLGLLGVIALGLVVVALIRK